MIDQITKHLEQTLHPLLRTSERMGALRALLAAATHINNMVQRGEMKSTREVIQIIDALNTIRIDIYKEIGDNPGHEGNLE